MEEHKIIGKGFAKVDAQDKATGRAKYAVDIKPPRMLHGAVLRSSFPHARILRIDTSKAESLTGVKAVITSKDAPDTRFGFVLKDGTILAREKVRYVGEAVALVAAVDRETAAEALEWIQVEYEELPAVFDPEVAMTDHAPIIHEGLEGYLAAGEVIRSGNICSMTRIRQGDVEQGFQEADHIFEDRFSTQMVHQGYLEPHVAVAEVDSSGRVTIWSSTQSPFGVRAEVAETLLIPLSRIRVMTQYVGGGFGGKFGIMVEPYCVLLAQKTGRPVKIVMSRKEEFTSSNPRHPTVIELKTGVKKDGSLLVREGRLLYDTGAFAGMGPMVANIGARYTKGPYRIPHLKVDAYCVYTNKTSPGLCRGAGNPQATFASESQIDIIASELGIDPVAFRFMNGVEEGDLSATGQVLRGVGFKKTLEVAAEKARWGERASVKGWGKGVGCMQYETGGMGSSCWMRLNEDGSFSLITGVVDLGQGSSTVLKLMAAEALGVSWEDLTLSVGDTDIAPYDLGTGADRITFSMGNAVLAAAGELKTQLFLVAAGMLEANPDDLEIEGKRISVKGSLEKGIGLGELALACNFLAGGPLLAKGSYLAEEPPYDPETIQGGFFPSTPAPTFATQIAEVAVDSETGRIDVLWVAAAHDVGFTINPVTVEGQIEGGAVMGVGYGLSEEIAFDKGRHISLKLADYKVPTAMDAPPVEALPVEERAEGGPFGAKGVGEPGATPTAPAIANAVFSATGVRVKELPITPERLYWALRE